MTNILILVTILGLGALIVGLIFIALMAIWSASNE
jgi:hypothetical protein